MNSLLVEIVALQERLGREESEIRRKRDDLRRAATRLRLGVDPGVVLAELHVAQIHDLHLWQESPWSTDTHGRAAGS